MGFEGGIRTVGRAVPCFEAATLGLGVRVAITGLSQTTQGVGHILSITGLSQTAML